MATIFSKIIDGELPGFNQHAQCRCERSKANMTSAYVSQDHYSLWRVSGHTLEGYLKMLKSLPVVPFPLGFHSRQLFSKEVD